MYQAQEAAMSHYQIIQTKLRVSACRTALRVKSHLRRMPAPKDCVQIKDGMAVLAQPSLLHKRFANTRTIPGAGTATSSDTSFRKDAVWS